MNIAIVSYHNMGGSGIIAYELGAELARRGHNIHFMGLEPPFRMNGMQANVMFHSVEVKDYPVFTYPPYALSLASQLYEVIERYDIDTIHCHYAVPHAVAGLLARQMTDRPVKVVTTLHGTDITLVGSHPSFYSITKWAISNSDCVTAVSDFLARKTEEVFDIEPGRINRIYNFVNEEFFNPDLRCECVTKKCSRRNILVHASNLRDVKQPLDVIRAYARVHELMEGDCMLWILGEGPRKYDMEKLTRKLGLEKAVDFLGVTSNPGMFFACADLFLLTSREESFGLAALEAMACSTGVVAYASGGLPEVVEDGVTGVLVPLDDTEAMAQACVRLLKAPEELAAMKKAANRRALNTFSRERAVEEYLALCSRMYPGKEPE